LFVKGLGATYAGAVGGLLSTLWNPSLGPFTFVFATLFGVFVDAFLYLLRVKGAKEGVNRNRLIVAMAAAMMLIALASYSTFAVFPQFVPFAKGLLGLFLERSLMLDMLVLFMGPATGVVAGYATAYLWNKYLRHIPT